MPAMYTITFAPGKKMREELWSLAGSTAIPASKIIRECINFALPFIDRKQPGIHFKLEQEDE